MPDLGNSEGVEITVPPGKLAHLIEVEQIAGRRFQLVIDGEPFPWYIAEKGVRTGITVNELPYVDIRIIAEQVTFNNDWRQ